MFLIYGGIIDNATTLTTSGYGGDEVLGNVV
jgi:hypothetical protein